MTRMFALAVVILLCVCCVVYSDGKSLSYVVSLTTIPPRFNHIHHTIFSWLKQSYPPSLIVIFIPRRYRRFRKKGNKRMKDSFDRFQDQLISQLLSAGISGPLVKVVETTDDWGPLTKFIGSLYYQHEYSERIKQINHVGTDVPWIDYWVYCDDDVRYLPDLASHYQDAFQHSRDAHRDALDARYHSIGYTVFSAESRLRFQLVHEATARFVNHIQGVDTYAIPTEAFGILTQRASSINPTYTNDIFNEGSQKNGVLEDQYFSNHARLRSPLANVSTIERIVRHYHRDVCPESFYQDDYIVSFLLNLAGVNMVSIRDPCAVVGSRYCSLAPPPPPSHTATRTTGYTLIGTAEGQYEPEVNRRSIASGGVIDEAETTDSSRQWLESIEGGTKEHFQMHVKEEVFERESITQQCLMGTANDAYLDMHAVSA